MTGGLVIAVFFLPSGATADDAQASATPEVYVIEESAVVTETTVAHDPMPWGLELDDARQCTARQGGAWGWRADGYVGVYSCGGGSEVVLAPPGEPAVNADGEKWIVFRGEMGQGEDLPAPRPAGVAAAYSAGWQECPRPPG